MNQIPVLDAITSVVRLPQRAVPIILLPLFSLPKNKRTYVHAKRSAKILGSIPLDIELREIKWDIVGVTKMLLGEQYVLMFSDLHFVPHTDPRKPSIQCVSLMQVWHTGQDESVTTVEDLPIGKTLEKKDDKTWCVFEEDTPYFSPGESHRLIERIRTMP